MLDDQAAAVQAVAPKWKLSWPSYTGRMHSDQNSKNYPKNENIAF